VDASGNGNTGTVMNGPLTFGAMGANFNGQQYVDSTLTVTSSALTVSVWFNAANLSNANPRLVANSHTDSDAKGFQLMFNGGGASGFFDVGNGTAEGRASWSQQLVAGTWYHYVGVYDGATVSAYLNGVQVASAAFAGGAIAAGTGPDINIACNPAYRGDYFIGAISDVRIYKRGLSAAEILALYQAVTPPPPLPATPIAIALSPASATIADNSPAGTLVATANVTMSDGSQFKGTLTTNNTNLFVTVR
jgi:large repetitive protein